MLRPVVLLFTLSPSCMVMVSVHTASSVAHGSHTKPLACLLHHDQMVCVHPNPPPPIIASHMLLTVSLPGQLLHHLRLQLAVGFAHAEFMNGRLHFLPLCPREAACVYACLLGCLPGRAPLCSGSDVSLQWRHWLRKRRAAGCGWRISGCRGCVPACPPACLLAVLLVWLPLVT